MDCLDITFTPIINKYEFIIFRLPSHNDRTNYDSFNHPIQHNFAIYDSMINKQINKYFPILY